MSKHLAMSKYSNFLFVVIFAVVLFSCTKPFSSETAVPPTDYGNCKDCKFNPWCEGSEYTYTDSATGEINILNYQIIGDTTIDGVDYQVTLLADNDTVYHNCSFNVTKIAYNNGLGMTLETILKADAAIGETWTDTMPNNPSYNSVYYTLSNRLLNRTVGAKLFIDVIEVKEDYRFDGTSVGSANVYYAKGVGMIDRIAKDPAGTVQERTILEDYLIP